MNKQMIVQLQVKDAW